MTMSVLVVDDDAHIREVARFALARAGYTVELAVDGLKALERVERGGIDLVVLDVLMPELDGLAVCRRLHGKVPIVFLSSRGEEVDRVLGLELGADDYLTKPFSPRELVARVRARLRRGNGTADAVRGWRDLGNFSHDPEGQRVRFRGQLLELTRYEYWLMAALLARPGAILSREQLMDDVWRDAPETVDRTVDTHVKTLRAKLRQLAPGVDPIQTHRGLGYSLKP